MALSGEILAAPSRLFTRALLLLSGVSLLRDLGLFIGQLFGLRRRSELTVTGHELVAEETTRLWGRVLGRRRRSYAMPAVATLSREVPYARLFLLFGLAGLTLFAALLLPLVVSPHSEAARIVPLYAACAVLVGIAFDLLRFVRAYLWRGHCAITLGVQGGDVYHLGGVSEATLGQFVERIRAAARREPASAPPAAAQNPPPPPKAPARARRLES